MPERNERVGAAIVITFFSTMIFSFILFYGGCRGLVSFITSHKTCERFSIDNYEIRTYTDIPDTKSSTCLYDTANRVKSSIFILDLTEKELSRSIEWNNLKKVTECTFPGFRYNPAWNDSISKLPTEHLYSKWGSDREDSWVFVLDSANQTFWAELVEDKHYKTVE